MSNRLYRINLGQSEEQVTESAGSATTAGLELNVDTLRFQSKGAVLNAIRQLQNYITEDNWPPQ